MVTAAYYLLADGLRPHDITSTTIHCWLFHFRCIRKIL